MEGKRRIVNRNGEIGEIKKGPWRVEEDEVLINHVRKYGPKDWSSIRSKGLLQRTGKSCRLRWVNKLRPDLKTGVKFSAEEERTVIDLQAQIGNKWAKIATYLNGRTDNDVKNFWSSRQKRLRRILNTTSSSSSTKVHKNNTKEVRDNISLHEVSSVEAQKLSLSTEEESLANTQSRPSSLIYDYESFKMAPFTNLAYPSLLDYEQTPRHYSPCEKKPLPESQSALSSFRWIPQLETPFPLESQDFITRTGDPYFLDIFGSSIGPAFQIPIMPSFLEPNGSDSFIDDYPPIDMFDHIDSLPSPSEWS